MKEPSTFSNELLSDMKQLLIDVSPNFEENLKRAFKNEGVRIQSMRKNFIHSMDDVLVSLADTKIELRDVKFPWIPDFRIIEMSPDLSMSSLDISLNLGNLKIEADYEAHSKSLQKWLPVSHVGKLVIGFSNVKANGKVGLVVKYDSLFPQNYDVSYNPEEISVRVKYHVDSEKEIENEIVNTDIEATLGKTVWIQLTEIIADLLHKQLAEAVVEFSVAELLADRDEEYREYAKEQASRANKLLDSLLCGAKDYLVAKELRVLKTPAFDVIYKGKVSGMQQGTFKTEDGFLQDLATLTRIQSFSLYEDKQKLTVYGGINLREFKHGYTSYESDYSDTNTKGAIKSAAYKNRIFVKIVVKKEGERCLPKLESLQVAMINDIDIDISGLASLSWLQPRVKSWVIGNLRQNALPVLEMYVKEAFLHAIATTDCVSALVD